MAKKEQLRNLVKKGLLVGVGVAAYAREKAEKLVKELVKKEGLSKAEGKKLVRNIYQEADKSRKRIASAVETELKKLLKTAKPAKKSRKKKRR